MERNTIEYNISVYIVNCTQKHTKQYPVKEYSYMKITGIIAEYNPFHNGHLYQIEQVKKNGADYVVVIMSGDFLQRGTPAIFDKWTRTKMALSCGADLIIELPAVFATASAQYFARGGVSILDKLGCVDTISFGCESNDISMIQMLSSYLSEEPVDYKEKLQKYLRAGNSFPKARELALTDCLSPQAASFASSPNNILALEYCIALSERNSSMNILPIKREGSGYHDTGLDKSEFASATAIREILKKNMGNENTCNNNLLSTELKDHLPEAVYSILTKKENKYITQNDFSSLLHYKLLTEDNSSFAKYADVTEDLSDKIHKNLRHYSDYTGYCELLKSKELTYSRINRALTHILLNITQEMYADVKENDYAGYARILGFKKEALPLLSEIGKNTSIPLISKSADASNILSKDILKYLEHDIFCSHVYESIVAAKSDNAMRNEYQREIIRL